MAVMLKKTTIEQPQTSVVENSDDNIQKIKCSKCGQEKETNKFYPCYSKDNKTGFTYLCKECCETFGLDEGYFTKESAYRLCKLIDKPYKEEYFLYCQNPKFKTEKSKIGAYIQISNSSKGKARQEGFSASEVFNKTNESYNNTSDDSNGDLEDYCKLFGKGFQIDEYEWLGQKYYMLIDNYPIRTKMHQEMLIKYCKYALREDQALAENDMQAAKYWGDLASKTATSAKINPNQLSVADLSDGMNCFSQIAQAVEREIDIIDHLPKYLKQPQDRVDYTIYMILDYLRDLEGKPHINYEDVWKFMNDKNKENEKKFDKGVVPNDENELDPNAILVYGENKDYCIEE